MSLTPVSFTGFSEFSDDFQAILQRTFEVANFPIQQLQTEQTINLAKQQALGDLSFVVSNLESEFASLGLLGATSAVTASSSDEKVATVTVAGTPTIQSYDLVVTSEAKAAQETSLTGLADTDKTGLTADGIYKLTVGTTVTNVDLLTIGSGRTAGTTGSATPSPAVSVQVDFSNGLTGSITANLNSFFVAGAAPSGATAGDTVSVTFVSEDSTISETITTVGLAGGDDASAIARLLNDQITANANLNGKVSFSDEGGKLKLVVSDTAGQGFTFTSSNTGTVVTGLEGGGTVGGHSEEEIAAALNAQVALDSSLVSAGVVFSAVNGEVKVRSNTKTDITTTDSAQGTGFVSGLAGTQTVEAYDNTLEGFRDFINAQSTTLGVKATLINTSSDTANPSHHLTLTATTTGTTTLKLEDSTPANLLTVVNQGTNAVFTVNGVSADNSSNTITDFAPGLSLTIVGAGSATVSTQTDRTQISTALGNVAADYNAVVAKLGAQFGEAAGVLSGSIAVRAVQQALRDVTSFQGSGAIKSMVELGLELDSKGLMTFNAITFNALTDTQINDTLTFIGDTTTGFAGTAFTGLKDLADPVTGQIKTAIDFLKESDKSLADEILEAQERVDRLMVTLEAKFAAADLLLAQIESQQRLLTAIFEAQALAKKS